MANQYFQFKQFRIDQEACAMKVTTDGCLFGAWVARQISQAAMTATNRDQAGRALDIGTGTGLLSLMLAQQQTSLSIDAIELEAAAARQAADNFQHSPWSERIKVFQADIRHWQSQFLYDYILCNPPFYEHEIKSVDATRNIAHHQEGLTFRELLPIIKTKLAPASKTYLLLPAKRKKEIGQLLDENGFQVSNMLVARQTEKHEPFRLLVEAILSRETDTSTQVKEIIIRDQQDQYTTAFVHYLKDYYLYL